MLVKSGSREEIRIRNLPNLTKTNKVQKGLLNPSPITSKTTRSKDPSLRVSRIRGSFATNKKRPEALEIDPGMGEKTLPL